MTTPTPEFLADVTHSITTALHRYFNDVTETDVAACLPDFLAYLQQHAGIRRVAETLMDLKGQAGRQQ